MSEPARPRVALPSEDEVCAHRDRGLHPFVLWLPTLGSADFAEEARRQAEVLVKVDEEERDVMDWIESVSDDVFADAEWT